MGGNMPKKHHECKPFLKLKEGTLNNISDKISIEYLPDKIANFMSHSVDQSELIKKLCQTD